MNRKPVILDVDTGIDDAMALVIACAADNLDIKGVTTVAGNVELEHTTRNTLNVLKLSLIHISVSTPTSGIINSFTRDVTIFPKAPPIITPTAISITLPFRANFLKSFHILVLSLSLIHI